MHLEVQWQTPRHQLPVPHGDSQDVTARQSSGYRKDISRCSRRPGSLPYLSYMISFLSCGHTLRT